MHVVLCIEWSWGWVGLGETDCEMELESWQVIILRDLCVRDHLALRNFEIIERRRSAIIVKTATLFYLNFSINRD